MLPYSVLVVHRGKKKRYLGFTKLEQLELFVQYLKEQCPFITIYLVNHRTPTPKPPEEKVRGKLWCPYCATWRNFVKWADYKKCSVCHISTEEFATKTANDLWPRMAEPVGRAARNKKGGRSNG